jgi:hypothetical protein
MTFDRNGLSLQTTSFFVFTFYHQGDCLLGWGDRAGPFLPLEDEEKTKEP